MTLTLCFVQLQGETPASWIPIVLNLFVHIFMYYYYLLSSLSIRVWWKKHLTTMQITQFVLDLIVVGFGSYTYFAATYVPALPNAGGCAGSEFAATLGMCTLTSYLALFVRFFIQTYREKEGGGKGKEKRGGGEGKVMSNGGVREEKEEEQEKLLANGH